jgi:hypothetical protein
MLHANTLEFTLDNRYFLKSQVGLDLQCFMWNNLLSNFSYNTHNSNKYDYKNKTI